MKRIFLAAFIFTFTFHYAQQPILDSTQVKHIKDSIQKTLAVEPVSKDTAWKTTGFVGLNFAQTALSNWQGGGEDNLAILALLLYDANYKKAKNEWNNKADLQFGIIRPGNAKFWKKNTDQIFFLSQFNLNAFNSKNWFYSLMTDFRSQFAPGYLYTDTARKYMSNFNAPSYIQLALGFEYKDEDYFSVTLSPLAGKVTIVNEQTFADRGDYGVQKAVVDTSGKIITHGKRVRYEFGGRLTIRFKRDIAKNFNIDTYADFFSNYFDHPENIDVVWNTVLSLKINKWLSATASIKMLYDNDVVIKYDWNKDGKYDNPKDINGPRTQVMSSFGVGLGYRF